MSKLKGHSWLTCVEVRYLRSPPDHNGVKLSLPEVIPTERLVLERLKYEDADEIFFSYSSKPEATKFMAWPTHATIRDTRQFLEHSIKGWDAGTDYSYAIRLQDSRRFIGSIGLTHDQGKVQFGYIISPSQWGQGYASEACRKLMETLQHVEGVYRIGTFVDAENLASVKVLLKSGLVEEARLMKWFRFVNQGSRPKDCILFRFPGEDS